MILIKPGVTPRSLTLLAGVANVAQTLGITIVVTAGSDGVHKTGSLHYKNAALDLRTRDMTTDVRSRVIDQLKKVFPPPTYDVILEIDHIHLEDNRAINAN